MLPDSGRFWSNVRVGSADECWPWQAGLHSTGYGRAGGGNQKYRYAHRVAWLLANGPIPAGLYVCHRCDNRPCCNPAHLFLGTCVDNVRDRHEKGRDARGMNNGAYTHPGKRVRFPGENNPSAKLTAHQVAHIRELADAGWTQKKLADTYQISMSQAGNIVRGERWRNGTAVR